jgi:hypothetical protein
LLIELFLVVSAASAAVFTAASASVIAALDSGLMLSGCRMVGGADVSLAIAGFVGLEVIEGLGATFRQRPVVAVMWIVTVVDVAVVAVMTVVPGPGSDEDAADEPVGAVVAIGRTVVGRVIEVAIGADRCDPDADCDLGWRYRPGAHEGKGNCEEYKRLETCHKFSLVSDMTAKKRLQLYEQGVT